MNLLSLIFTIIGLILSIFGLYKNHKSNQSMKRIGQLSHLSNSLCKSLDQIYQDLVMGKIGANSAQSVLKPIQNSMNVLNNDIQDIYKEMQIKKSQV